MKVLLSIGNETYLLRSEVGLNTIIKALSGARHVIGDKTASYYDKHERCVELYDDGDLGLAAKLIPNSTPVRVWQRPSEDPELLGLPEHGTRQD